MSFVMNLTDNDPHLECRREIHRLRAENEQLHSELAAIRDARDEEIDTLKFVINDLEMEPAERIKAALQVCDLAKARSCELTRVRTALWQRLKESQKQIAEQAKELKWAIRYRDNFYKFLTDEMKQNTDANEAQKQREIAACERAKIPYGGCDTVHDLADVIEELRGELAGTFELVASTECDANRARIERDEAIGLLKWVVELDALETDLKEYAKNPTAKSAKRILELTAKREEK